ncbi:apolipoprotein L6-like [Grammomys surdaster]|uniref:apolipoprotein L6-like n=1 Tax=Grammomys surdaster TaxID=491861 RepID=UPI0010A0A977|nr:apolipoprotein L6-like [Grammomys surdaster]
MALVQTRMLSHQTGEEYEADVELQRDKDGSLDFTDKEEGEVEDDALTNEDWKFLKQFPSWEKEEKKRIRTLYAIADHIDKSHQKATKTKVVTNSASVISGALSLLGLALAPTTAGASLVLTAVGNGLGTVAGVTNIVTNVRENSRNKRALAQANSIMPSSDQELEEVKGEKTTYVTATGELVQKCGSAWDNIKKHLRALRVTRTQPHVTSAAKKLMTTGQLSTRSNRQVQKAFGGTALAMTKSALMFKSATAALSLGQDIYTLWEDWKDLKSETPTELAKELRARAGKRELVLAELTHRYKKLKVKAGFFCLFVCVFVFCFVFVFSRQGFFV